MNATQKTVNVHMEVKIIINMFYYFSVETKLKSLSIMINIVFILKKIDSNFLHYKTF